METTLTPSHQDDFQHVSIDVDVEDFDHQTEQVEALQGHPAEGGQQRVVESKSHVETKAWRGGLCSHLTGN